MSTESWVISAPRTIDITDVHRVVVHLNDGSVDVVGDPGRDAGAAVEITEVSDRPVQISVLDGELRIGYDFSGVDGFVDRFRGLRDKDRAVVRVVVPSTVPVRIATARAGATVVGVRADVSVNTASGVVRSSGGAGPVSVKTASAAVDVVEHLGDVRVSTGSGAVTATGMLGRVSANTVSGNVQLVAPQGTPLIEVRTVSGDVAVRLAPGTPVNIRARSVTGTVVLDGTALESTGRTTSVDHADTPGASGAYVSTSTVSGDLAVSRV